MLPPGPIRGLDGALEAAASSDDDDDDDDDEGLGAPVCARRVDLRALAAARLDVERRAQAGALGQEMAQVDAALEAEEAARSHRTWAGRA